MVARKLLTSPASEALGEAEGKDLQEGPLPRDAKDIGAAGAKAGWAAKCAGGMAGWP